MTEVLLSRIVPFAIALSFVGAGVVAGEGADICIRETAWDSKIKKGLRQHEKDKALDRAIRRMSKQAWATGRYTDVTLEYRSVRSGGDARFTEDRVMWQTSHETFEVDPRLARGRVRWDGDKRRMDLEYCVSTALLDEVRADLEGRYSTTLDDIRSRFEALERAIGSGDTTAADRTLDALVWDVYEARAGRATYRSPSSGRTQTFDAWLDEYRRTVRDSDEVARRYLREARDRIDDGHLVGARRALEETLEYDRSGVSGYVDRLQAEIDNRYERRRVLLAHAESLAAVGRFGAADSRVEDALELDRDDQASIDATRQAIGDLRAAYLVYNPKLAGGLIIARGALGVDHDGVSEQILALTGADLRSDEPLQLGLEGACRFGRFWQVALTGSLGVSAISENAPSYGGTDLLRYYQLIAGVGFRTVRTASRSFGFRLLAGPAYESVNVDATLDGYESSGSAVGFAVRAAAEFGMISLFVQQGVGFAEEDAGPASLVRWRDQTQFGLTLMF